MEILKPQFAFAPENRSQVNQRVKSVIRESLILHGGSEVGIARAGGNRSKKQSTYCTIGAMFRDPEKSQLTGQRNLNISGKEILFEFKPTTFGPITCRRIAGTRLPKHTIDEISNIFKDTQAQGFFLDNYAEGLAEIVRRIVINRRSLLGKDII